MKYLTLLIRSADFYDYDYINVKPDQLKHLSPKEFRYQQKEQSCICTNMDSLLLHYFVDELLRSDFYRNCFIKYHYRWNVIFVLETTKYNTIDYKWNDRISYLVRERCEIDHILSWLSTLGGAFSALGDYFEKCAHIAGKISIQQLKLAMKLGDPIISSRCRLYLSLSLIQKKRFKMAKKIIRSEYNFAKNHVVIDQRLERMCKGIWAKLQYEYELYRNCIKIKKS